MKKNIINFSILYFLFVFIGFFLTDGETFYSLYNSGLDTILNRVIQSETDTRVEQLIISLDKVYFKVCIGFFFFLLMILSLLNSKKIIFSKKFYNFFSLEEFKPTALKTNIYVLIALAAGLGLFIELAIIRIHSSYFQLFAYFKNLSLLSCFLGLGIGYSFSKLKLYSLNWTFPLIALQVSFMYILKDTPITLFFKILYLKFGIWVNQLLLAFSCFFNLFFYCNNFFI